MKEFLIQFFLIALPAALLTHGGNWFLERSKRKERTLAANYAALRIASILETFALDCASMIDDNNDYDCWYQQKSKPDILLPKLGHYPDEIDWKALSPRLVGNALSFPNDVMMGNRLITRYAYEPNSDPETGQWISSLVCGAQGVKAMKLASELRDEYNLLDYRLDVGQRVLTHLEEYKQQFEAFQEREAAHM